MISLSLATSAFVLLYFSSFLSILSNDEIPGSDLLIHTIAATIKDGDKIKVICRTVVATIGHKRDRKPYGESDQCIKH